MTEENKINCPFCGNLIEVSAYKCPHCDALFAEPELPEIRFQAFAPFIALNILTFGLFSTFWFFANIKPVNKLVNNTKDGIKVNWLFGLLLLNIVLYFFYLAHNAQSWILSLIVLIQIGVYIALTYRVLRIIQKFTQKKYNVNLEINPFYVAIFNILYLSHFIDTYKDRVMQVHEYFNAKSPQIILLVILLLIIQFMACLNTSTHQFFKWLFGL